MADWSAARREASEIAQAWTGEGGPGGAIVLFDRDGIRETESGGFAVIEHRLPFTPGTQTRFASLSKHVLAALLLREGAELTRPLGTWLDDLPEPLAQVELGRALDMTGALPDMMEALWQQGVPFTAGLSAQDILSVARRLPGLNAAPGTEMAYSNTGWRLAQRVLERVTGVPYAETVAALAASMNLDMRFVQDAAEIVPGLATGYWRDSVDWRRGHYGFHFSASGGMAGSAAALVGWLSALLAGRGPLPDLLARLAAPRHFADGGESAYRLGLVASRLGDVALIGHGGSLPGYRNHFLLAPDQGLGVVVMTNREEDALWPALRVLAALLGEALPEPARDVPTGLFAEADGPFWAELANDSISVMGGYERLVADGAGWRSLPAYLDIRLRAVDGDTLEGMVGGRRRRLSRVPQGGALDGRFVGRWRDPVFGCEIAVDAGGNALMPWPTGGAATRLTPLPGGRALADLVHGPWRHRPCLCLEGDDRLLLASHRARIMQFDRVDGGGAS